MKTELERTKAALDRALKFINYAKGGHASAEICLREIDGILNPPPEMETVEVERWTFGDGCDTFATEDLARHNATYSGDVYRLTGTRQRPKPQKVERSMSVGSVRVNGIGGVIFQTGMFTHDALNKVGTLTFKWTE